MPNGLMNVPCEVWGPLLMNAIKSNQGLSDTGRRRGRRRCSVTKVLRLTTGLREEPYCMRRCPFFLGICRQIALLFYPRVMAFALLAPL